nr:protein FAM91A1-like isoform X1 [Ipomoea trifida]
MLCVARLKCMIMSLVANEIPDDRNSAFYNDQQPYDSIPNFSAADALRLTGVGRNEFIDIMNKCKSKMFWPLESVDLFHSSSDFGASQKIMWKLNKSIARELLPTQAVDFVIEPWWGVCLVNFTLEEFKKLTEEEMATIDKICKEEVNSFILFDPEVIKGLHRRGLVYFDVPVYPDDRFKVSRLEGFVSNREQSYEDPIEELLYAVFVVSSENSTVAELAATLQAELSQLQAAASFACRLGWAIKLLDPASILHDSNVAGSPKSILSDEDDGSRASLGSAYVPTDGSAFQQGDVPLTENQSMASGLKDHAVKLYEAGKLGHASIADLCKDLSTLEGAKFEGELQEFANHAFSLRCVLECLASGGIRPDDRENDGIVSFTNGEATIMETGTSTNKSGDLAIIESGTNADNFVHSGASNENADADQPVDDILLGTKPEEIDNFAGDTRSEINSQNEVKSTSSEGLDVWKGTVKLKKYRVDILRCESLAALSPATLDCLFIRDYDIVVSMIPLPPSSVLPGPKGPVHFGPPSHSFMTPWMKLSLYSAMASGPLSVVLMKGQCLRMLPAPLAGCEKALVWSWDGSSVGGLGGKSEGNLVKGSVLLHCVNSLLKCSAVLVQPLSRNDLDESGEIVTIDIPLPLKNSDGSTANIGEELGLHSDKILNLNILLTDLANKLNLWSLGYIRLLRLFKEKVSESFADDDGKYEWVPLSVEFGIPLFSPKLCNYICKRVVSSQLLQTDLYNEHHEAMQGLRKRLLDVCAEYRAIGPTARLLYQKEQPKESTKQLMTYASGRWNPLVDPPSPISGKTVEQQRFKLANRQRCRTEVLSFDGNILRSYALTPVCEADTRLLEDSSQMNTIESDDANSKEVIHPGVNILFDGSELRPFDIAACYQARLPVSLIAEASARSAVK